MAQREREITPERAERGCADRVSGACGTSLSYCRAASSQLCAEGTRAERALGMPRAPGVVKNSRAEGLQELKGFQT